MSISDWTRSETISAPNRIWISWTTDPVGNIPAAEREQLLLSTTKSNTTSSYLTLGYRDASGVLRTQDVQVKNEDIRSTTKASVNQEWIAARLKYGRGLPGGNDFERSVREMFYVASTDGPAMVREVTTTYISYVALAGQLQGIPYWWNVPGTPPGTVYYDPPEGEIISQYTVVEYQQVKTAEGRDVTRTLTSRWVALGVTSEGKSAFGQEMQKLRKFNVQTAAIINRRLGYYGELVFQGTEVQVSTGRVPVPIKPSDADLANNEVVNGGGGGGGGGGGNDDTGFENPEPEVNNDKTITGRVIFDGQNYDDDNPTVTATYDMPFAPDDYFYYDGGTRKLQRSGARRAAEKFGQCEAALDIGHAFGQNIVTNFDLTPTLDLAPVYIRLAGIEGAFLLDAPSYAWGPEGMVVSSDLLLIGVTGYDGLSAPAASWLRLPVSPSSIGPAGVTTVESNPAKANTIAIPGGFDVRNLSPVFAALPTNGADVFREWRDNSVVLPPTLVLENDTIAAGPTVAIVEFSYELDAGTDTETLATGPAVEFAWLTQVTPPVAVATVAALAPAVRTGVRVSVPAAAVSLAGVAPTVASGASVAIPAAGVGVAGITPDLVGRQRTQVVVPATGVSVAGLAPSVATGVLVAVPAAGLTVAALAPAQIVPAYATGGTETTITVDGITYRVHTFTTVGTSSLTVLSGGEFEYLVIAGGGGGAGGSRGAGGGAAAESPLVLAPGSYTVVVGDGGAGNATYSNVSTADLRGTTGGNSQFATITANGGGGGGAADNTASGRNGGSGGGAWFVGSGGTGITGQGFQGGTAGTSGVFGGGGGGGAGGAGGNGSSTAPGNGGAGVTSSITGTAVTRAGGGAGANYNTATSGTASGGGGLGRNNSPAGQSVTNGAANTGGGGGAGGGKGGSGVVIVRYRIG